MFNLDEVIEEEAAKSKTLKPWPFEFDGETYELPAEIDIRGLAAIQNGRLDDGLRQLLNPEQWAKIQASPKLLTNKSMARLLDAYYQYVGGLALGESAASTGSSKSTGRPSKRTSNASTKPRLVK